MYVIKLKSCCSCIRGVPSYSLTPDSAWVAAGQSARRVGQFQAPGKSRAEERAQEEWTSVMKWAKRRARNTEAGVTPRESLEISSLDIAESDIGPYRLMRAG